MKIFIMWLLIILLITSCLTKSEQERMANRDNTLNTYIITNVRDRIQDTVKAHSYMIYNNNRPRGQTVATGTIHFKRDYTDSWTNRQTIAVYTFAYDFPIIITKLE